MWDSYNHYTLIPPALIKVLKKSLTSLNKKSSKKKKRPTNFYVNKKNEVKYCPLTKTKLIPRTHTLLQQFKINEGPNSQIIG